MNTTDKQNLKIQLEKKLLRVESDIIDLKELTKPIAPDCAIGRISRMDAINNKSVNEAALRKKEDQFNGIKYSLSIIDKDHFGKCNICGKEIAPGRLFLVPESVKCVACASR